MNAKAYSVYPCRVLSFRLFIALPPPLITTATMVAANDKLGC